MNRQVWPIWEKKKLFFGTVKPNRLVQTKPCLVVCFQLHEFPSLPSKTLLPKKSKKHRKYKFLPTWHNISGKTSKTIIYSIHKRYLPTVKKKKSIQTTKISSETLSFKLQLPKCSP